MCGIKIQSVRQVLKCAGYKKIIYICGIINVQMAAIYYIYNIKRSGIHTSKRSHSLDRVISIDLPFKSYRHQSSLIRSMASFQLPCLLNRISFSHTPHISILSFYFRCFLWNIPTSDCSSKSACRESDVKLLEK